MENNKNLPLIIDIYAKLLQIPPTHELRFLHQKFYSAVRNEIAKQNDVEPEIIQSIFERVYRP